MMYLRTGEIFILSPLNLALAVLMPVAFIGLSCLLSMRKILKKSAVELMKGDEQKASWRRSRSVDQTRRQWTRIKILFNETQFPCLTERTRRQFTEIHAARHSLRVPHNGITSRRFRFINKRLHFATRGIEDRQAHKTRDRDLI